MRYALGALASVGAIALPIERSQAVLTGMLVSFLFYAGAVIWVFLARTARRAWIELLWIAAGLLALLPVLNALTTDRPLWRSVADGDWVYAGFDLMMWAFAALHALLAIGTGRHRARPRRAGRAGGAAHVPPALPGRGEGRR
ncbi:hypothetical protein [Burkholderia glumae]|uniref:hypothetical protein n=1 Tax=Burkholderia glumae TaxID=337 RepID=UPI0001A4A911|nr:PepSY-associated TM helix protein [Burkholderia glumae BGR1]AJY63944.1 putative pepSY-associated TM helix protein [Burkholderia glumae LMG 2196 = ATCC 33617]QKM56601.1 hypothetical protein CG017_04667 [Burkholderia glumae]QTP36249.1 hypothetical protein B7759_04885 [Burkholderia glumae]